MHVDARPRLGRGLLAMKRTIIGSIRVASTILTGVRTGYVFKFVGNVRDLSDGTFDLGTWLRRVKRVS